jgi:hypothetical protein
MVIPANLRSDRTSHFAYPEKSIPEGTVVDEELGEGTQAFSNGILLVSHIALFKS